MSSFSQKRRLTVKTILFFLLILNIGWFGLLIFNRFLFYNSNEIKGARELGLFCLYFFGILLCLVLSGFELRLINEKKFRILSIETKIDYFARLATFGIAMLLAYVEVNVEIQKIILLCEAILLCCYELIFIAIRNKDIIIIVDWTNKFYNKGKEDKILMIKDNKYNLLVSFYFVSLCILLFFAVGLFEVSIPIIICSIVFCFISIISLFAYMMRVRNKKADVLTFLSAIGIVLVLSMSYFVSIYLLH